MLTEKFKKQCAEYTDFMEELEKLTNDFCTMYEQENPFSKGAKNRKFNIDKNTINISWEKEVYACGWETFYESISIPLDFYEKIDSHKFNMINIKLKIEELEETLSKKINKKISLHSEMNQIQRDSSELSLLKNKYKNISFEDNIFKEKKEDLFQQINVLSEEIDLLEQEIKELKFNIKEVENEKNN